MKNPLEVNKQIIFDCTQNKKLFLFGDIFSSSDFTDTSTAVHWKKK